MVTDIAYPILDKLEAGETVNEVNPLLAALFRPSVQPYLISWFKYDPQAEIKKLKIPVLVVQGEQDLQVSVDEAKMLSSAYPKAQVVIIPGMNHVLKPVSPDRNENVAAYSNPTLPLAAPLLPAITSFVKSIK